MKPDPPYCEGLSTSLLVCPRLTHRGQQRFLAPSLMKRLKQLIALLDSIRTSAGISRFGSWFVFGSAIGIVAGIGAVFFTFSIDVLKDLMIRGLGDQVGASSCQP